MKPTIITASGRTFDMLNPTEDMIAIEDIAHALSHICRFTGHTARFYSVAEHSIKVSHIVPPEYALVGLLHDATEAYLGDVSTPLKALMPDYRVLEDNLHQTIFTKFGLDPDMPACIKEADLKMLATEKHQLIPPNPEQWAVLEGIDPLPRGILTAGMGTMPPDYIKGQFLRRFRSLQTQQTPQKQA